MEINFFGKPLNSFPSLLVQPAPNLYGKIASWCIYFSFMLYDNLFLLFPSLYYHLNRLSISNPRLCWPPFMLTPCLLNWGIFSNPLSIRTPVYLALESKHVSPNMQILLTMPSPLHVHMTVIKNEYFSEIHFKQKMNSCKWSWPNNEENF